MAKRSWSGWFEPPAGLQQVVVRPVLVRQAGAPGGQERLVVEHHLPADLHRDGPQLALPGPGLEADLVVLARIDLVPAQVVVVVDEEPVQTAGEHPVRLIDHDVDRRRPGGRLGLALVPVALATGGGEGRSASPPARPSTARRVGPTSHRTVLAITRPPWGRIARPLPVPGHLPERAGDTPRRPAPRRIIAPSPARGESGDTPCARPPGRSGVHLDSRQKGQPQGPQNLRPAYGGRLRCARRRSEPASLTSTSR